MNWTTIHSVQFRTRSNTFREFAFSLNAERDRAFGSGPRPNFELNFGSVQIGSGSNLSSEPNFYNPIKESQLFLLRTGLRSLLDCLAQDVLNQIYSST